MGRIIVFLLATMSLEACATNFPYKYYGLDLDTAKLMGPSAKDDMPLNFCAVGSDGYKCVVIEVETFRALRKDYDDKVERLKAAEQP